MILAWMLSATLFSACVALVAAALQPFARALGRPTRWLWSVALGIGALWPPLWLGATRALPRVSAAVATLPVVRVAPDRSALLGDGTSQLADVAGRLALGAWGLASLLLAVRLLRAVSALRRLRDSAEQIEVDGVSVLLTDDIGPATIGLRRPDVIVPRTLMALDEPLRRLVLRHEREHGAARDPWLLLGCSIALVLEPWNAALWFVSRRLRLALEIDCDSRVLAAGADPARYGRLLLWMAHGRTAMSLAPTLAAPPSHLDRRIAAMRTRHARPRPLQLVAAALLVAVGLAGACSEGVPDVPVAQRIPQADRATAPTRSGSAGPTAVADGEARQIPGTGMMRYPADMRRANREGEVVAQFVVDARGLVDTASFRVLKSSDPSFTSAVRSSLATMRFRAATLHGRAVRQLVTMPFTFTLQSNP